MRLESALSLKQQLLNDLLATLAAHGFDVRPTRAQAAPADHEGFDGDPALFAVGARSVDTLPGIPRFVALGVAPHANEYRLAVRLQRPALLNSPIVDHLTRKASGEVDVRLVGRIDKRARASRRARAAVAPAAALWYQANTRPLLMGASVGHADITAGTIGAFVKRAGAACILSNNHVLANENRAESGDVILQRARLDGGQRRTEEVARLFHSVSLKRRGANRVDAAIAKLKDGLAFDSRLLRGMANGQNRTLKGLGPAAVAESEIVYKIGRTTGPTKGRVTAFDLDNLIVNYDLGNLRFDNQIEIEGVDDRPFSDGGDSGALIVNSKMEAVALLFAGSDMGGRNGAGLTFANPIHRVLKDVKATLLS